MQIYSKTSQSLESQEHGGQDVGTATFYNHKVLYHQMKGDTRIKMSYLSLEYQNST